MSEMRENRRSEILKAACIEFSENGYESAKMEQIAKRAGIGKSTVYEYFSSKNELLIASCEWGFGNILSYVTVLMQEDMSFCEKVATYIKYACDILNSIGNGMIILYGKSDSAQIVRSSVHQFHSKLVNIIEKAAETAKENGEIRDDISTRSIANIIAFMPSPVVCQELEKGHNNLLDDMISILIHGFAK